MSTSRQCHQRLALLLFLICIFNLTIQTHAEQKNTLLDELNQNEFSEDDAQQPHSRQKRLVWITDDGRLALPPGTTLTFTPTIAMPLVRHPPEGFFSNLTISFPLTIDFDKLGLTDNQNPLGDLPPIFSRSFGHTAGNMLGHYVARYLNVQRRKRDLSAQMTSSTAQQEHAHFTVERNTEPELTYPELPEPFKHHFHGGERVLLYGVVEDFLSTFGMDGKACLLRTICEIHSRKLEHFGVFGEMAKLFLTVTKSPYADLMPEYVQAQGIGEGHTAPGECFPYYKACPKSVFRALKNKYSSSQKTMLEPEQENLKFNKIKLPSKRDELLTNEIPNEQKLSKETVFM